MEPTNKSAPRVFRWVAGGVTIAVLIVASLAAALALYDWNNARGWIAARVQEKTGRELTIRELDVHPFSLHPRIEARGVSLSNADWADKTPMVAADRVNFSVSLPALLAGRVVMPDLTLDKAQVSLQRDARGRRNWALGSQDDGKGNPPEIGRLVVNDGRLVVKDVPSETDVVLNVHSTNDARYGVEFTAKGRIKGLAVDGSGKGGKLLELSDAAAPYPLMLTAAVGQARAAFEGTVAQLATLGTVNGRFSLAGTNLALLADNLGLSFPHTAPYQVAGRLLHSNDTWSYADFSGTVGKSDLRGTLAVDLAAQRPLLTGKLLSNQLDIADLGGLVGERPGVADSNPGKVLPSEPVDLGKLRRIDARVSLVAKRFHDRDKLPLDDLNMTIALKDGVMKADPLVFGVAGGSLGSRVTVDAREGKTLAVDIDTRLRNVRINKLVPGTDMLDASFGAIDGAIRLKGRGDSAARVLGSANGRVDLVSRGGQLSNLLMEFAGADLGEIIKFFVGGDRQIQLRCGVAAFAVRDGVMSSEAFVIDTDDTYIGGTGRISLRDETIDMKLTPLPKDVSILSLRGPLLASGTFARPRIGLEKKGLARRIGAAVLLGLINPLAAIIPTIETGPGRDKVAPCGDLIASLKDNVNGKASRPVPPEQKKRLRDNLEEAPVPEKNPG